MLGFAIQIGGHSAQQHKQHIGRAYKGDKCDSELADRFYNYMDRMPPKPEPMGYGRPIYIQNGRQPAISWCLRFIGIYDDYVDDVYTAAAACSLLSPCVRMYDVCCERARACVQFTISICVYMIRARTHKHTQPMHNNKRQAANPIPHLQSRTALNGRENKKKNLLKNSSWV